ncbi:MAG: Lrp/AsnC family transcriptional regulator [Hyphomicrobiaceae bacterium]|nr:Lrp/AsnC family transcriptional regulator [Hyphomicrobiaceae bacterium]MCC0024158.1 Lrp/AsnC family transcriptional regulator [Hyphomicrobiaceae bacterium]
MIDAKDEALIDLLRKDARMPLKALGASVGLSISAVRERIARLVETRIIEGFTIRTAPDFRPHRALMMVTTQSQQCAVVAPKLEHIAEIVACDSVGGEVDLVLDVSTASSARMQEIRDQVAGTEGVVSVVTLPVLVRRFAR